MAADWAGSIRAQGTKELLNRQGGRGSEHDSVLTFARTQCSQGGGSRNRVGMWLGAEGGEEPGRTHWEEWGSGGRRLGMLCLKCLLRPWGGNRGGLGPGPTPNQGQGAGGLSQSPGELAMGWLSEHCRVPHS